MTKAQNRNDSLLLLGNIIDDESTIDTHYYHNAGQPSIFKSSNPVEIRFWYGPSPRGFYSAVFLIFNKGWKAVHYQRERQGDSTSLKGVSHKQNLDTLFSRLVDNNIFSLYGGCATPQEKIYFNPYTSQYTGSGMGVGDGAQYSVQFKVGGL